MKIASWNVNSIKVRLPNLLRWLESFAPDVVMLQETKCMADAFPTMELEAAGYHSAVVGQKSYNGVALLSRNPLENVQEGLPGDAEDSQARYLEATTAGLRVASIYLPNGNPVPGAKFDYKLAWMARLRAQAAALAAQEVPVVLGGDWNVIPQPVDCHEPAAWEGDALFRPESRAAFRRIVNLGFTEAFRALHPDATHAYTFWDYQAGAWQRDNGIRIDHLLLSPQAADRLEESGIDRDPRGWEKASDHTPVWCRLRDPA
ncbi:exodeoxyribonuclease III [Aquibaculum sediminis]|uniref:exodeoxyribonuclease III n=1 Tax=Aquibaculum sediminis TaxID=3231907 RepID=UPI00345232D5